MPDSHIERFRKPMERIGGQVAGQCARGNERYLLTGYRVIGYEARSK